VRFVKQLAQEASMTFSLDTLRIVLTDEEILEDLLYPGHQGGVR
jgi:hypothetical protein